MNKPNLLNLFLLLLLWQLTAITHAQDTTSYVRPWPLESLQMPEQVRMQTTGKQGIPRHLQNHTFADTIVDTTEWEGLEDIEIVYAQALGTSSAHYSLDIELLDDGGFLVPWFDYNDGFFHITRLDSVANEIYTNNYENISNAYLDLYRDGKYVYMAGRVNLDSLEPQYNHVALIKYDLQANDTVFFKAIRPCEYAALGNHISYLTDNSTFLIAPTQFHNAPLLYEIDKTGVVLDSIENQTHIKSLFSLNDQLYAISQYSDIWSITENLMDSLTNLNHFRISGVYISDNNLYILNTYEEIIAKYNTDWESEYISVTTKYKMTEHGNHNIATTSNKSLLATPGVNSGNWWPPDEDYGFGLIKLHPNGSWLHKLYLGGANFQDQAIYTLSNGDYLLLANADQNPMGYGTIFFTRIKPWDDGVGITSDPVTGQLNVYPNPAHDAVHVKLKKPENGVLTIHDISGKLVQQHNVSVANFPRRTINISNLKHGIYILQLQTETAIHSTRIIKK